MFIGLIPLKYLSPKQHQVSFLSVLQTTLEKTHNNLWSVNSHTYKKCLRRHGYESYPEMYLHICVYVSEKACHSAISQKLVTWKLNTTELTGAIQTET